MTCFLMSLSRVSSSVSSVCWVDSTTVSTRTGRLSASYSIVTWVLPSGRRYGSVPSLRACESLSARRCAITMGSGMSTSVSSQA
jgi:hypothetical protein